MPSIALLTSHVPFPWLRQIPGESDRVGSWRFTINELAEDCELVVVYDDPPPSFPIRLPIDRRVLIIAEPPGIKTFRIGYFDQFGTVLGPVEPTRFSGRWLCEQPALAWFFGIGFDKTGLTSNLDWNALKALPPPPKQAAISVVISKKANLPKHRARLQFVDTLQKRHPNHFHVFGRGFRDIADKAEAILPYAYHLVLENNDIPHFWTEKTADAFLGWALPVFSGCSNLNAYFPGKSHIPIDIDKPEMALREIDRLLEQHPYQAHFDAISEARAALMHRYELFQRLAVLADDIAALPVQRLAEPTLLATNKSFELLHRPRQWLRDVRRSFAKKR